MNIPHLDSSMWTWDLMAMILSLIGVILALGIFLGIRYRHGFLSFSRKVKTFVRRMNRRLREWCAPAGHSHPENAGQVMETGLSFEKLYKNGRVYVFPPLVAPTDMVKGDNAEEEDESVALLLSEPLTDQRAEFIIRDLVKSVLQESTKENNPPSFLLHNTRLSRQENIILVLSRKLGVIVMTVKAVEDVKKLRSMDEAVRQLLEARKEVRERLGGLVKPRAVTAVLALPNLPWSDMKDVRQCLTILQSHPDVEVLLGQETADFQQWTEQLTSRPDSGVWNLSGSGVDSPGVDSADTAYAMVASKFLTLTGCSPPGESPRQPAAEECWLLTPAQLQVRDSTARLLHIWGPPGSGKTTLMIQKARELLEEGKAVVLVGRKLYEIRLAYTNKFVRSGQDEETCRRIRVCRTHQEIKRAVKALRGPYPHKETCIVVDGLRGTYTFRNILSFVQSGKVACVWSTCRDNLSTFDAELWTEARQLGWESVCLPDCIRCTESTVELLNLLMQGSPDHKPIPACSLPCARDIPTWRVVDHCLHPQHTSTTSSCPQCKEEMSDALPSLEDGLDWTDWIALYTGNPDYIQLDGLCEILENVGVSTHYECESDLRSHPVSSRDGSHHRSPTTEFARFRELVVAGVNETGEPTVHLLPCDDFRGMEKKGVIVVHWDERDNDPDCQSEGDKEARLKEHREQWFCSVSRSKGQVILLLLTPSPARTLLDFPEPVMQQGRNH